MNALKKYTLVLSRLLLLLALVFCTFSILANTASEQERILRKWLKRLVIKRAL